MPPRSKVTTNMPTVSNGVEAIGMVDPEKPLLDPDPFAIRPGDFVHVITSGGSKYKQAEVLSVGNGLTLRTSLLGPTQAEVSFIPWTAIDGVGLCGKR